MGKSQPPHHDLIVKHITWPYSYLISGGVLIICLMCLCFFSIFPGFCWFWQFFLAPIFVLYLNMTFLSCRVVWWARVAGWGGMWNCENSVEVASNVDAAVMTGHEDDSVMMLGCWGFEDDRGDDVRALIIWGWNNPVMMLGLLRIWGWYDTLTMLGCWGYEDDMIRWRC